ncbi:MAG: FAD-dependent oxidoreductase [Clostridia bacterium]|nr:FAD-dependent oxidoreductase [Clostridia bacterium]
MIYSKELKCEEKAYDLIVCGGGVSGFAAALAAAEEGMRVLLIERGGCIGGVATQGMVNHILGGRTYRDGGTVTSIGGIYKRLEERLLSLNAAVDVNRVDFSVSPPHGWSRTLSAGVIINGETAKLTFERFLTENGVDILYNTAVVDVIRENEKTLAGLVIHNKSGLSYVCGKYFADTTGDADIAALAGCPYFVGDDEGGVAPASLELHVDNVDSEALSEYMRETNDFRFKNLIGPLREKGIWDFPYEIFISVMMTEKDVFMINTNRMVGIDALDARSVTQGIIDAREENYKLFEIMKNHFPGFGNARIRSIAPALGIRESRRIVGEYVLTVDDLIGESSFDDAIAYSVYGWDLPDPKKPSLQPDTGKHKPLYTPIPYRCLLPQGVDNLIVAGRCISVERPVLGPVRVMAPCIAMGEAAGCAAGLALSGDLPYKDVDVTALRERIILRGGMLDF